MRFDLRPEDHTLIEAASTSATGSRRIRLRPTTNAPLLRRCGPRSAGCRTTRPRSAMPITTSSCCPTRGGASTVATPIERHCPKLGSGAIQSWTVSLPRPRPERECSHLEIHNTSTSVLEDPGVDAMPADAARVDGHARRGRVLSWFERRPHETRGSLDSEPN